ncbi:accessory gene regulator protein B [[Clostridium] sordellii]|uniref:accessory gene regulator ArgB-like protein n=1 Tax=Paraclostridium sordellii TaxID=1505 RepID=UPI0005DDA300|nr:accessory gene regulator B family protein [Paeniclostridium sordellii]CEP45510.1 accessory gene regulator protein B [[Clostridium] sordellii] [Paeniclostridium sordellii]
MVKSCANRITSFLISNKAIKREDYELYSYGFETLIAFFINISIILIIGYFLDKTLETILFLIFYCPIRQFSGGYHADNYLKCLIVFISIYILNVLALNNLGYSERDWIIFILACISYLGIWYIAPLEHRQKPLTIKEKNIYKKKVTKLITIALIIAIICRNFDITYRYSIYIESSIICIFIMLLLGLIKKLRGEHI